MWTQEQNPITGNLEYVFNGMENGIGDSPYTGIANMQGLNIKNYPKCAYSNISRTISTMTGGSSAEQVNYVVQDPDTLINLYSVTGFTLNGSTHGVVRQSIDAGKTWTIIPGQAFTTAEGNGLFIYGGYLHVICRARIYTIPITSTGATGSTWIEMQDNAGSTPIFSTTTQRNGQNHYALVGRDGISGTVTVNNIYICNGIYIASIIPSSSTTYDPGNKTTYNWNETALGLPTNGNGIATSLCELRTSLLISYGNLIVPWDRTSTSYDIPFPFPETIAKLINIENTIYCFGGVPTFFDSNGLASGGNDYNGTYAKWIAGTVYYNPVIMGRGNIYYYNGFSGGFLKKIPDQLAFPFLNDQSWFIGGVMAFQNKLYFGAMNTNATSNNQPNSSQAGVYSLDISSETQAIQYSVAPSSLTIENTGNGFYTALCSTNNLSINNNILSYAGGCTTIAGATWNYKYDYTNQSGLREIGYLETDILQPGTNQSPKTFSQIEVRFRNPLASAEVVTVYARSNFNTSYTTTYTYTSNTADLSFVCPVAIQSNEEIQIQLKTEPAANGSGVPIKEIRLR
jgi:hypothetical protein